MEVLETTVKEKGLRFNEGKLRYDLLEPFAQEQLVKVFTLGAKKYAPRNWEKGMSWTSVVASMKRHIAEFEKGEDFDSETGLLHMAHAMWNASTLVSYYKIAPDFDDRDHKYLRPKRIALDIDDVLAAWASNWNKYHGNDYAPTAWYFDRAIMSKFDAMKGEELDNFYLGLPSLIDGKDIPFEPCCYVTSRPVTSEVTEQWLDKHNFPAAPVITVGLGGSKVQALKEAKVDIFVDDNYANFVALNNAGICTYLFNAPHNQRYNVGYKRIKSLKELI